MTMRMRLDRRCVLFVLPLFVACDDGPTTDIGPAGFQDITDGDHDVTEEMDDDINDLIRQDVDPDLGDATDAPEVERQPCVLGFDCDQGDVCVDGFCTPFEPMCTAEIACENDLEQCIDGVCVEPEHSPFEGLIVINEVLIDGNTDEDANGDGSVDSLQDAFVELVNVSSSPIPISRSLSKL